MNYTPQELKQIVFENISATQKDPYYVLNKICQLPPEAIEYVVEIYFSNSKFQNIGVLQILSSKIIKDQKNMDFELKELSLRPFIAYYSQFNLDTPKSKLSQDDISHLIAFNGVLFGIEDPSIVEINKKIDVLLSSGNEKSLREINTRVGENVNSKSDPKLRVEMTTKNASIEATSKDQKYFPPSVYISFTFLFIFVVICGYYFLKKAR